MRRKILMILLLFLSLLFLMNCGRIKNPAGPDNPNPNWPVDCQIRYTRILSILNPTEKDPDNGGAANVWNSYFGGFTSTWWVKVADNIWEAKISLKKNQTVGVDYYIYTYDLKVTDGAKTVGEKFEMKTAANKDWVQLTCVENRPDGEGKWSKFILGDSGILNPWH